MINFYFFLLLFIASSCSNRSQIEIISDGSILPLSRNIEKIYYFKKFGYGTALQGGLNWISLDYAIEEIYTIDQAREILVDIAEYILNDLNNNNNLQTYIKKPPLTIKDLHLSFVNFNKSHPEMVNHFSSDNLIFRDREVRIYYRYYDFIKDRESILWSETYDQAVEIVRKSRECKLK